MSVSKIPCIQKMWVSNSMSPLFIDMSFYQTRQNFQHYLLDIIEKIFYIVFISHTRNIYFFVIKVHGENS